MKRSRFSRAWQLPACVVALALPAAGLRAQGASQQAQSQYQGLGDSPETPSTLDKDYGLSFLGGPGSDQQKTMAPTKLTPPPTDFFKETPPAEGSAFAQDPAPFRLPKPRSVGRSDTETPLYTTTDGSEIAGSRSQDTETPLFDDGSDTADRAANRSITGTSR